MMRPSCNLFSPLRRRRATVLIIVMWIALGLVSLALYFGSTIGMEYRAADNSLAGVQSSQAIEGARRYLAFVLANPTTPGIAPSLDDYEYIAEDVPVGDAAWWLIGRDPDSDIAPAEPTFGLIDEASKLNINIAELEMLQALPEMPMDVAAAIVDWRDTDQDATPDGAESQDYLFLEPPYNAKDSEFESIDELRLVRGVDLKLLYGEDVNHNGVLDANEDDGDVTWPSDNQDGRLDAGLSEYLTAWSREPNKDPDGQPRVNVTGQNARSSLTQLLSDKIGESRGNQIMEAVGSSLSSITSPLDFYIKSQMTAEEFALVEDSISISDADYLVGLVNVRTAPAAVLACLTGMDRNLADQLVSARRGKDVEQLKSIAWVAGELDPAIATDIGPYITARSYQYSADLVALGHDRRGFHREWMVFDVDDAVRVIYRREWTRFGWPLGEALRQELRLAKNQ